MTATTTVDETTVPAQTADKPKRGRPARPEFDKASAVDADGNAIALEDDRLTGIPANWTSDFKSLGRDDFSSKLLALQYSMMLAELRKARVDERIADLNIAIHEEVHGVDPVKKKQRRREKLLAELAALEAQLEADGASA